MGDFRSSYLSSRENVNIVVKLIIIHLLLQAFPFCVWKWQLVTDLYHSLADSERLKVDQWVSQFPYGLEVVSANLNDCRVERKNNFLQSAKTSPKL